MILANTDKQFDIRLLQRNLDKGLIKQKDVSRFIKDLPDLASAAVPLEIHMEWGTARQKLLGMADEIDDHDLRPVEPFDENEE